jgi:hypothetical protein
MEWKNLHIVTVFENFITPWIIGIDAIHHMSIKNSNTSESFMFYEDNIEENNQQIQKSWLNDSSENHNLGKNKCTSKTGQLELNQSHQWKSRLPCLILTAWFGST